MDVNMCPQNWEIMRKTEGRTVTRLRVHVDDTKKHADGNSVDSKEHVKKHSPARKEKRANIKLELSLAEGNEAGKSNIEILRWSGRH